MAQVFASFLAGLGRDIVPEVRTILQGKDEVWIYSVLLKVVANMPKDALAELRVMADRPLAAADLMALDILDRVVGE